MLEEQSQVLSYILFVYVHAVHAYIVRLDKVTGAVT